MTRKPLCERYDLSNPTPLVLVDELPRAGHNDYWSLEHGYVVDLGRGGVFFFRALTPALVFGRAGRMSPNITGYGVMQGAEETLHCRQHGDETVLLHVWPGLDRQPGERAVFEEFAAKVRPESAHWHA